MLKLPRIEGRVAFTVGLAPDLHRRLTELSVEAGKSMNVLVHEALEERLRDTRTGPRPIPADAIAAQG